MLAFRLASTATTAALTTMNAGVCTITSSKNEIIEPNHLAELLKNGVDSIGKLIIVDCRRFLDYNTSHIKNAINVCCSKLIRKRLQENKMSILDILRPNVIEAGVDSNPISEEPKSKPARVDIILYSDQNGEQPSATRNGRPDRCGRKCADEIPFLVILMEKLCANPQFQSVRKLKDE